jgi:predicted permease
MFAAFNTIFPIISIIALGAILRKLDIFPKDFFSGANKLVYFFGITPLLFIKAANMRIAFNEALPYVLAMITVVAVLALTAWLTTFGLSLSRESKSAYIHCAMRGNYAYVGLPVVYYAFSNTALASQSTEAAIFIFTPTIIFHSIVAILIMNYYRPGANVAGFFPILRILVKDPLLVSCALGLLVNVAGIVLPVALTRTCEALGGMALPLALIGIGATINPQLLRGSFLPPLIASVIKTVFGPLVAFFIMLAAGLDVNSFFSKIVLLLSACSVGVTAYVLTEQYGGDGKLAGSSIFISAILSMISISIVIAFVNL